MTLRFTAPSWDLLIVATGAFAMQFCDAWPEMLLTGVASVALLQVRLALDVRTKRHGRGSKINSVLTWLVAAYTVALTLLRALMPLAG